MSLCFYINSRCYTPSFMASLLMGTQIGGMDLRPRNKATERPVRYMFRSPGFPWISCEITRTNFFDLPIWDSNSSSFSCRSFSSQREPSQAALAGKASMIKAPCLWWGPCGAKHYILLGKWNRYQANLSSFNCANMYVWWWCFSMGKVTLYYCSGILVGPALKIKGVNPESLLTPCFEFWVILNFRE